MGMPYTRNFTSRLDQFQSPADDPALTAIYPIRSLHVAVCKNRDVRCALDLAEVLESEAGRKKLSPRAARHQFDVHGGPGDRAVENPQFFEACGPGRLGDQPRPGPKLRMSLPTDNAGVILGSSQSPDIKPKKRRRFVSFFDPFASSNHFSASFDQNSRSSTSKAAAANLLHSCALVLRNF
jgi:hypothetical protein